MSFIFGQNLIAHCILNTKKGYYKECPKMWLGILQNARFNNLPVNIYNLTVTEIYRKTKHTHTFLHFNKAYVFLTKLMFI